MSKFLNMLVKVVLLVGLSACSPLLNAQTQVKHALTVEQCRADQKLWKARLEQQPALVGIANVSFNELSAWASEMADCGSVDPQFAWPYFNTLEEARTDLLIREQNFLARHNLWGQFIAEDAQGKGR